MQNAQEIIVEDLNYICRNLAEEFAQMAGKKLLITGGAGFLGYYLVQSVLHWNKTTEEACHIHVTVYDNYIRGVPDWLRKLEGAKNLALVRYNIIDPLPADVEDFQYMIHAAGIASPIFYRAHPIETMDANVNGLRNLLEYTRKQKEKGKPVEGFLFYSSSEIYGDPDPANIPTPETYRGNVSCTGPRACYDESKRYGETLCVNFAQQYDLPIKVARPFNNYGPGLKITDRRVIPDFARDVLAGKDIVMFSDGSPTRTFCYSADAIVGYYKVLVKGRKGEAYNVGVEAPELSMLTLAQRVADLAKALFGYQGQVIHQASSTADYLVDNPNRRCPIIDKARRELGYNPGIGLDDGLRRSLIWYNEHRDAENA
ncbi:MAG: NAD-dependent epimerase/dehydratase family protein [Caldilineaceae bacterium]